MYEQIEKRDKTGKDPVSVSRVFQVDDEEPDVFVDDGVVTNLLKEIPQDIEEEANIFLFNEVLHACKIRHFNGIMKFGL